MIKKILFTIFIMWAFCMNVLGDVQGKWDYPRCIRIYIQSDPYKGRLMTQAFWEWSKLTRGKVGFQKVISAKSADIEVEFVEKIDTTKSNSDRAIGLTQVTTAGGKKIVHAKIWIAQKNQDGKLLSEDELYTTMLHEIGHAIGLNHSQDKNSVMFFGVNVVQEISKEDLQLLKDLYNW